MNRKYLVVTDSGRHQIIYADDIDNALAMFREISVYNVDRIVTVTELAELRWTSL